MQLLPSTAADANVGIPDISDQVDANIHAGVKYLSFLRDRYFDDPEIDHLNQDPAVALASLQRGPAAHDGQVCATRPGSTGLQPQYLVR